MPYRERERQVEFFRRPADEGGASYFIATDAAGEGINLRNRYWLHVVFDCAASRPRLVRVCDPFGRLLATAKESVVIAGPEILSAATHE